MRGPTVLREPSFPSEQGSVHSDLLAESLFDEKSIATFFTQQEQKDFKTRLIANSLENRDITGLLKLGMSKFGFVSSELRRETWTLLLSEQLIVEDECKTEDCTECGIQFKHRDESQVYLDVKRSFSGIKDPERKEKLRQLLGNTIVRMLRKYRQLSYYQGYHDVVSVFVVIFTQGKEYFPADSLDGDGVQEEDVLCFSDITNRNSDEIFFSTECGSNSASSMSTQVFEGVVDEEGLFRCVEAFTLLYLRDFMMDSLDFPIHQLKIIPRLVKNIDKNLYRKLQLDKIEPFFAVSSILTLFSHQLKPLEDSEFSIIFCIFDYVICMQSMSVPLVMYSHLVVENGQKLLREYDANLSNFENSIDLVHGIIQKVLLEISHDENVWSRILQNMRSLNAKENLNYKNLVNKYSVLVTTASGKATDARRRNSQSCFEVDFVESLLNKEIHLNAEQKALREGEKKVRFPFLHHLASFACSSSFIYKISIFIGLFALLIKFHRDGLIKRLLPQVKLYIGKFPSSLLAGLYRESKHVWLDPLQVLFQNATAPVPLMNSSSL